MWRLVVVLALGDLEQAARSESVVEVTGKEKHLDALLRRGKKLVKHVK